MPTGSRVFLQNRALGYVSNHIPLVVRYIQRRKENLIVTCTGRAFHTYGCSHFSLLSVCSKHPSEITCLGADTYHVYTSSENVIYAWRRGAELAHTYNGHEHPVHILLPFGPHLVSVDESSNLKVWDVKAESLYLELSFDSKVFSITTALHPSTYINKILLGSQKGTLQLWNIRTSKLVYTFSGWNSAVTALEQAPAIDVVGIGLANGQIKLHNLKFDETIMEFSQDWGLVTSLSFRTDGNPIMASGSLSGHVVFWNLEERKVVSQLRAHSGGVSGLQCLANEPLMVTSSADNSVKLWIFDLPDGGARLLRIREGHTAPPSCIRFHGSNGHNILSAGGDSSLRIFSTKTETFNKSLGRASYNRKLSKTKGASSDPCKMPPIVDFTCETTREKEWDNIAAIHSGLHVVTTWSYDKVKMGSLKLVPDRLKKKPNESKNKAPKVTATCLCLTQCGNFVVIGYSSGHVDRFNIQSGIHRATYGNPVAHNGAVRGVATDGLNQIVVSGGSDTFIKFWNFKEAGKSLLSKIHVDECVAFFHAHHESAMLAVALEDFSIVIVDIDTRNIVRKFSGHTAQLTDAAYTPDSRWLVTSAMDCTVRLWDIPSSQLIDIFQVDAACTSLSFSPTGEFLATTHVDQLGVYLWSNRTLFSHISLRPLSSSLDAISVMDLPASATDELQATHQGEELPLDDVEPEFTSPDQLADDLITLSLVANSRWQNLLNIDLVKKRNKPKEAPKAPKAAPFFLPTLPTLRDFEFDLSGAISQGEGGSKILDLSAMQSLSAFGKSLNQCSDKDYSSAFSKLKEMGPAAIDIEINQLAPEGGGSFELLLKFMKMINSILQSHKDFEIAQAYLGLFLKVHGDTISQRNELKSFISEIISSQHSGWSNLQNKLQYNLCVVHALKNVSN
ncbi:WD repeat-containing protein 36 [Frankliniella occidentalis]|uniref:WD repeat-containing protein 36 n=1 Tax=Frankliniella occidentalis TaxID=133901 RepID=A0A6J1T855_FRAOC|nr:WD repeat-containing protein 36 [Frankliniella occidentalis]